LLAQSVEGAKKGGQELLGGMSITIQRNGWGSQVSPIETVLFFGFGELVRDMVFGCRWNRSRRSLLWTACGSHTDLLQVYSSVRLYVHSNLTIRSEYLNHFRRRSS
jgi:hypothetical protein